MSFSRIFLGIFCLFLALPAFSQEKKDFRYTYPQPPRPSKWDPMRTNPGYEVPLSYDKYVWKVTGKIGKKEVYPTAVPVYDFTNGRGKIGEIPVGTEVKFDAIRKVGYVHYYQIPFEGPGGKKVAWLSGVHIEPVSYSGHPDGP